MGKTKAFDEASLRRLRHVHPDMVAIVNEVRKYSEIDFGVHCGYRSIAEQQELFQRDPPVTRIDGINKKSKHNYNPSLAIDVHCYKGGKWSWIDYQYAYLAGLFRMAAQRLYDEREIDHLIRWGGNWDQDGDLIHDQQFDDLCHFELYDPLT